MNKKEEAFIEMVLYWADLTNKMRGFSCQTSITYNKSVRMSFGDCLKDNLQPEYKKQYAGAAKEYIDFLKKHTMSDVQDLLKFDAVCRSMIGNFYNSHSTELSTIQSVSYPKEAIMGAMISFCKTYKIMWNVDALLNPNNKNEVDPSILTSAKSFIESLLKNNLVAGVGKNAQKASAKSASTQAKNANGQTTTAQNTGATQAANNTGNTAAGYKQTGGHLKDIPNKLADSKIFFSSSTAYCIEADKKGKNTPNVFITPIKVAGAKGEKIITVGKSFAETVRMGSGNGWTDCKLWFDNHVDADKFLIEVKKVFSNTYTNIHVSSSKIDSNGYIKVSTIYGPAYIKALKLNEELTEEVEDDKNFISEDDSQDIVESKKSFMVDMANSYAANFD